MKDINKYIPVEKDLSVKDLQIFFPKNHEELEFSRMKMVDNEEDNIQTMMLYKKWLKKYVPVNRGKMEHFEPDSGINLVEYPV